ncbi:hypothetical protein RRG08_007639 [Elysia crispata]|uniref:Uncharacterized protein n=1 Tax=Elysia crispata TaxID=231223 RepID=A0AAE1CRU7_9GAST|nr:hypothetical protein RRG08_007639 [Elysia crispata]
MAAALHNNKALLSSTSTAFRTHLRDKGTKLPSLPQTAKRDCMKSAPWQTLPKILNHKISENRGSQDFSEMKRC